MNYYASPLNVGDFRSFFTQTSKFFVCFSDFIDKNYVQNNIKLIKGNSNFNKAFYSILKKRGDQHKMNKILNVPENFVSETLEGILLASNQKLLSMDKREI